METKHKLSENPASPYSDPTYEAWKHLLLRILTIQLIEDSDPTYEAWKPGRIKRVSEKLSILRSYL